MSGFVEVIKQLLNIKSTDEKEDEALARDIEDYEKIVTSTKFADSNADTTAITNLFQLLGVTPNPEGQPQAPAEVALVAKTDQKDRVFYKSAVAGDEANKEESSGQNFHFRSRLAVHLELLKQLEFEEGRILPGQPVYEPAKFGKEGGVNFVLQQFRIPNKIYDAMAINDIRVLDIHQPLTQSNYVRRFQTLLWIEEAHQAVEMRRYDMDNVMLGKYENFFSVMVPGLAEGRPSLMRGDKLILRNPKRSSTYEGYIHDVRERDVLIKLHEHLHGTSMDGLRFDISFVTSRTPFRRCHHGVVQFRENTMLKSTTFPLANSKLNAPLIDVKETDASELRCFRKCLNVYQRTAIISALRAECRPAPYIIFGPPGTGKTLTMVEVVLQAYARKKSAKILVCGNSNACVDLLAEHIKNSGLIPTDEMIRVAAFYRMDKNLIPESIQDIAMDMDMIDSETYSKARIIITTCIQSGCLYGFHDRFDYVFIDEAGHASEPESMISISLLKKDGCCVLAGDPHQLGPVCMSNVVFEHGLGTSLLERLSRRTVYSRQAIDSKMTYDTRYISQLLICYRCDPRVLSIGNEMFYNSALKYTSETPSFWLDFLKVNHPLVFHPVKGKDRRDYANPSWFNPNEAFTCLGYVNRLYSAGLKPEQLGIITPYKRQIEKLRLLFDSFKLEKCKIATMEEFQGDEREIIIISTVRSRQKNMEFDKRFRLGFLFNPKRFNVALSRAKWMVIAVGDPDILTLDECWKVYMDRAFKIESVQYDEKTT